jgi:hypothetical protein
MSAATTVANPHGSAAVAAHLVEGELEAGAISGAIGCGMEKEGRDVPAVVAASDGDGDPGRKELARAILDDFRGSGLVGYGLPSWARTMMADLLLLPHNHSAALTPADGNSGAPTTFPVPFAFRTPHELRHSDLPSRCLRLEHRLRTNLPDARYAYDLGYELLTSCIDMSWSGWSPTMAP